MRLIRAADEVVERDVEIVGEGDESINGRCISGIFKLANSGSGYTNCICKSLRAYIMCSS